MYLCVPACVIDGTNSSSAKILATLVSIMKQTFVPVQIIVLYDFKTYIDKKTIYEVVSAKDSQKISFEYFVENQPIETQLLETIKSFKTAIGVNNINHLPKKFPITHALVIKAGLEFKQTNVVETIIRSWGDGTHYIACMLPTTLGYGTIVNHPACVYYLPDIRRFCITDLWKPLQDAQTGFDQKIKGEKDVNYTPIAQSRFGKASEV